MNVLRTAVIIAAAGDGTRMDATPNSPPKQYMEINGEAILYTTIKPFVAHEKVDEIVIAARKQDFIFYKEIIKQISSEYKKTINVVEGGLERRESVANALEFLSDRKIDQVLIHDAARPLVSSQLIDRVLDALSRSSGVTPVIPITDTLKRAKNGAVLATINKEDMYATQTPQGFAYSNILLCHRMSKFKNASDDASLMEACNIPVDVVLGERSNIKITCKEDLDLVRAFVGQKKLVHNQNNIVEDC